MKPIFKKILIPTVSALAGGLIVFGAFKFNPSWTNGQKSEKPVARQDIESTYDDIFKKHDEIRRQFDSLFKDDLFHQQDPFEQMRKMREQIEKRMDRSTDGRDNLSNPFDSWFSDKFGGGTINDISQREDDTYIYYDIKVDDVESTSINTKIKNGYITITGTTEQKNDSSDDNGKKTSMFKSTFNRTFPLPENVDQNKMQMNTEKNKIVLKFPKIKN